MKLKNWIFAVLCIGIATLIIYTAFVNGKEARRLAEYEQALADIEQGTPETVYGALYFNKLSKRLQYIYKAICTAVDENEEYTEVIPFLITQEELDTAVEAVEYDKPEYFYINPSAFTLEDYVYEKETKKSAQTAEVETVVVPVYRDEKYSVLRIPYTSNEEDRATFKTRLKAALVKADSKAKDVQDRYLQVRLLHDYLTDICSHFVNPEGGAEISQYVSTSYGALVEGEADSVGYAKAFKLLWARYDGISHTVYGRTANGGAAWNVALINDKYYNIDIYEDDLDSVINGQTVRGISSHVWLCRNDESFYKSHSEKPESTPVCTDIMDYYTKNSLIAGNSTELQLILPSLIQTCASSRSYCFEVVYTGENPTDEITAQVNAVLLAAESPYGNFADTCKVYRLAETESAYAVRLMKSEAESNGES